MLYLLWQVYNLLLVTTLCLDSMTRQALQCAFCENPLFRCQRSLQGFREGVVIFPMLVMHVLFITNVSIVSTLHFAYFIHSRKFLFLYFSPSALFCQTIKSKMQFHVNIHLKYTILTWGYHAMPQRAMQGSTFCCAYYILTIYYINNFSLSWPSL